ncbi:hypothetical protein VPLG_00040 [Vibrio phage eugene 12A10]|uniref:hypothetical protein n=1 Tax=Vibrio phage eugene 12A10 TaxID=573172 RepID=UPI0003515736|nr:hypothetical protein VPLG_00040 [Vibrio phage eugene 12A10]AGN51479.1 hypothetical protein VPLG_00040 [Vibrio phage eugene 12A10]
MLLPHNKEIVDQYCVDNSYNYLGCIGKRLYFHCTFHNHHWNTLMGNISLGRRCKFCAKESASLKRRENTVKGFLKKLGLSS